MPDLTSPGGDLEPIERASADELRALQLERLRWSRGGGDARGAAHTPPPAPPTTAPPSTPRACTPTTARTWPTWLSTH